MMTKLCAEVLQALPGKTLVTAESLTGGGIGSALTAVSGSSAVYKGGVISYTNWVKENILGVSGSVLEREGAVSAPVALSMAEGVRKLLNPVWKFYRTDIPALTVMGTTFCNKNFIPVLQVR